MERPGAQLRSVVPGSEHDALGIWNAVPGAHEAGRSSDRPALVPIGAGNQPRPQPWEVPSLPPALNECPQEQDATAFGLWIVNPPPISELT